VIKTNNILVFVQR